MANLRDRIKGLAKAKIVPISFGGVECYLRRWNEKEQIEWAIECQNQKNDGKADLWVRCKAIARSLCDENGVLIYSPDEYEELALLDSEIINPAWDAVVELQGTDADAAKKNSQAAEPSSSA